MKGSAQALLSELGERKLISKFIEPLLGGKPQFKGDDTAVIPISKSDCLLITIDAGPSTPIMSLLGAGSAFDYGHFVGTMSFSDIAAMGGVPVALVAACLFPRNLKVSQFSHYIRGIAAACKSAGSDYVGGDTKESEKVRIVTCVVGKAKRGSVLLRSGAKPGDLIAVSGTLGKCLASYVKSGRTKGRIKVRRPEAKIRLGQMLRSELEATACMDMSDGPLNAARELAARSEVAISIKLPAIRVIPAPPRIDPGVWQEVVWATGGCDFELMVAIPKKMYRRAAQMGLHVCGQVTEGKAGVSFVDKHDMNLTPPSDWEHYKTTWETLQKLIHQVAK